MFSRDGVPVATKASDEHASAIRNDSRKHCDAHGSNVSTG